MSASLPLLYTFKAQNPQLSQQGETAAHSGVEHLYPAPAWCCHSQRHHKQLLISQNVIKAEFQERLAECSAQGHFLKVKGSTKLPCLQNSNPLQRNMSKNFKAIIKGKLTDETTCFSIVGKTTPCLYL